VSFSVDVTSEIGRCFNVDVVFEGESYGEKDCPLDTSVT
jgi:hypothetical protein